MANAKFTKEEIERAQRRVWEGTKSPGDFRGVGDTLSKKLKAKETKAMKMYSSESKWR